MSLRKLAPALILTSPALLMVTAVIFLPALYVAWLSFYQSSFGQAPVFVGFANYAAILTDPQFWRSLGNTIAVVLCVVHVELVLALGLALLFAAGLPWRTALIAVLLAPYAISEVTAIVVWKYLFDIDIGIVTNAMRAIGLPGLEWAINPVHGLTLVSALSIWQHLPFTFIILYAARLAVPKELYEAATIDGASAWQRFRSITLPAIFPAMIIAMLFRYIFAFRMFSEVWLLTGGGPARQSEVIAIYLYLEAFRYNKFGVASATGWLLVAVSLALASVYVWGLIKDNSR